MKKFNKLYLLVGIVLVISILAFALSGINKKELILKINDENIGEEEYFRAMSLKINEVKNEYMQKSGEELPQDFWFESQNGEDPIKTLYQRSLEEVKEFKTIYILAKENGNVDSTNFDDIEKRREEENKRLKEENGTTIFGAEQYSQDEFEFNEVRNLRLAYIQSSNNEELNVTDDEIRDYFNANIESLKDEQVEYTINFVEVENPTQTQKSEYQNLVKELSDNKKLSDIIDNYPSLKNDYQKADVGENTVKLFEERYPKVYKLSESIDIDNSFAEETADDRLVVVQNTKTFLTDEELFEEKKDEIKLSLQTIKYSSLVKERAELLKVEDDEKNNIEFTKDVLKNALN